MSLASRSKAGLRLLLGGLQSKARACLLRSCPILFGSTRGLFFRDASIVRATAGGRPTVSFGNFAWRLRLANVMVLAPLTHERFACVASVERIFFRSRVRIS